MSFLHTFVLLLDFLWPQSAMACAGLLAAFPPVTIHVLICQRLSPQHRTPDIKDDKVEGCLRRTASYFSSIKVRNVPPHLS